MVRKEFKGTFRDVAPLEDVEVMPLRNITRCLHIDDVQESLTNKKLISQPIKNTKFRSIQNVKVLWFAPETSTKKNHNFYGNMSFVIDWEKVRDHLGRNIYLIDQAIYNYKSFTRILVTNNTHYGLRCVDDTLLQLDGMPLQKDLFSEEYQHVTRSMCLKNYGIHELQFGIELCDSTSEQWLFMNCTVKANNHMNVNVTAKTEQKFDGKVKTYQSYKCFKFNTAQDKPCPFPYSEDQTENMIENMNLRSVQQVLKYGKQGAPSTVSTPVRTYSTARTSNFNAAKEKPFPSPYSQDQTENMRIGSVQKVQRTPSRISTPVRTQPAARTSTYSPQPSVDHLLVTHPQRPTPAPESGCCDSCSIL